MAEILKPDEEKKKKEEAMEVGSSQESKMRVEYLQMLKHDELFQKFVIKEILDPEIERLTDIRNVPMEGEPEKIVSLLATTKAARALVEKLRSKLVL